MPRRPTATQHRIARHCVWIMCFVACACGDSDRSPTSSESAPIKSPSASGESPKASLTAGLDLSQLDAGATSKQRRSDTLHLSHFEDVSHAVGVDFVYDNHPTDEKLMTEATGGGAGWLDFDADGFVDLLLTQAGGPLQAHVATNPLDQLFQNLEGREFRNVTASCRLTEQKYSQGVAIGDFDNDGFDDVYITNVGPDSFFHNMGDGTFEEQTKPAQLNNPLWGSTAAWADLDQDGDLDLFVCNYTDYNPESPLACFGDDAEPGICHPNKVPEIPNKLFVNNGDGTFTEILSRAGLDQPGSKSLGVVIADFNEDSIPDIYVANDTEANHLFINTGDLTFIETAISSGCAVGATGHKQASMGIAFGDYNRDGYPDLYLTHFTSDTNTLYQGLGSGAFNDATQETGMHLPTISSLGFGTVMADFNCDGHTEIFVANGHIDDSFQEDGDAWKMPPQLFAWDDRRWRECSLEAGGYFSQERLGRGVAMADFDRDGDVDLAVCNQGDPAALLQNDQRNGHWLRVRFLGTTSNRRGVGCKAVAMQGNQKLTGQLAGGTSYCVTHEPVVSFGLGDDDTDVTLKVEWPSGRICTLGPVAVDQEVLILESDAS